MLSLTLVAFGAALSSPVSDGDRFLAVQRTGESIEIRDEVKHLKRTLRLPCAPVTISRGGVLLVFCGGQRYVAVDLLSGAQTPFDVPFDAADPTASASRAEAAGREWVQETHTGYRWGYRQYRNLRTGEVRQAEDGATTVDLDAPQLTAPLCAPIVRQPQQSLYEWGNLPGARFAAFDTYDGRVATLNGYGSEPGSALLWSCGEKAPRRIAGASGLTAGAGWATWRVGSGAYAQRLARGGRIKLRGKASAVVHTRKAVYTLRGGKLYRGKLSAAR